MGETLKPRKLLQPPCWIKNSFDVFAATGPFISMQFAVPPRGNAYPPWNVRSRVSLQRRRQFKVAAVLGFAVIALLLFLSYSHTSSKSAFGRSSAVSAGTSGVVIVTVLDRVALSDKYVQRIKKNREDYAKRHGMLMWCAVNWLLSSI